MNNRVKQKTRVGKYINHHCLIGQITCRLCRIGSVYLRNSGKQPTRGPNHRHHIRNGFQSRHS